MPDDLAVESEMPLVIKSDPKNTTPQAGKGNSAVVKQRTGKSNEPPAASPKAIIIASVLIIGLIVVMINAYIQPFRPAVKEAHRVAPLPGYPDVPPYNVKEWQEMYKSGKATLVPGVPRMMRPAASTGGGGKP